MRKSVRRTRSATSGPGGGGEKRMKPVLRTPLRPDLTCSLGKERCELGPTLRRLKNRLLENKEARRGKPVWELKVIRLNLNSVDYLP